MGLRNCVSRRALLKKIELTLDQIRPNIHMDGGDIELVKFEHGIVYVRLHGACVGCPVSMFTLKLGVEKTLKDQISEVNEVVAVE